MVRNGVVSVIIPVYNRPGEIGKLLLSIKRQSYKDIETIVVDDGSSDNTPEIAKKYSAKVFVRKHAERSVQRNFGANKACGNYLFFPDSDMELTKDVIYECVNLADLDKKIGAISIPEESIATKFWEKVKAFERSFYNLKGDLVTDAARFFRREAFYKVGGYDTKITGPEDWDLPDSIKASGYKIGRIKAKIFHYEKIESLFSLMRKKYYYGLRAHTYLSKQNVSVFSPKTIYFLRPVFYKNWKILVGSPIMTFAMFVMFTCELVGGGFGYLAGRLSKK